MQPLPSSQEFLNSIDAAYHTEEVRRIARRIDEFNARNNEPVLQALCLCDIYNYCVAFAARGDFDIAPPPGIQTRRRSGNVSLQATAPFLPPTPQVPGFGRRSNAIVISPNQMQKHGHAKFERQRALQNIKARASHQLRIMFGCGENQLEARINERFARDMTKMGRDKDLDDQLKLITLDEMQRAACRISFHEGAAHMLKHTGGSLREVLADTSDANQTGQQEKHRLWCYGYVFTGRELYVQNHAHEEARNRGKVFYHSSFLGGAQVECAGDISFLEGRCTSISNLSGHYQPPARALVPFIRFLKRLGVDIDGALVSLWEFANADKLWARGAVSAKDMWTPDNSGDQDFFQLSVEQFLRDPMYTAADQRPVAATPAPIFLNPFGDNPFG